VPQLEECPHCHQPKLGHHACPSCGWYNGRQAIHIRQKSTTESGS
jgi:large subunit ribosomal protein L32